MLKSCAHIACTESIDGLMHGNQAGMIANQSEDMLVEGNFHYFLKPKFCLQVKRKSFPDMLLSNSKAACSYMAQNVKPFHEPLTKGVNQLLGDPSC